MPQSAKGLVCGVLTNKSRLHNKHSPQPHLRVEGDCIRYENEVLFVACGPRVYDMLKRLQADGRVRGDVVGIAHPSGTNTGRIQCYLGKVEAKDDSYVWCQKRAKEAMEYTKLQ